MIDTETQKKIVKKVEEFLKIKIAEVQFPKQGMDGDVFLAMNAKGNEFAVKFGVNAINVVIALDLIRKNKLDIPVPKLFGYFSLDGKTVAVLEKINFPLLESMPGDTFGRYIGSMVANLKKIHSIRSNIAGHINEQKSALSWKDFLLFRFSGRHPWFDWDKITACDGVDAAFMRRSIKAIVKKIENQKFIDGQYSLVHTDFNQRNLFVDPESGEIAGIVDWGDAIFGDPIYDFARIRMLMWHFNIKGDVLEKYYELLRLTEEEKKLEELYLLSQIIEYIGWYSATKNDFNASRLKLHQDFLRAYKW